MAGNITEAQKAAKACLLKHGIKLEFYDYASLANAIYTVGPIGDIQWAVRDYFRRNHREIELPESVVAEIAESTYIGFHGYSQAQRVNKG